MQVLILGAGAVGLGIGSALLQAGTRVDFAGRERTVRALREKGLERSGIFGDFHAGPERFGAFADLRELSGQVYDHVLVCVKSTDSEEAARQLAESGVRLRDGGKIILFQNGWGNAEIFEGFFPPEIIYNARVITGFRRPQPHTVEVTVHADAVHIGSLFGEPTEPVEGLCEQIAAGGLPCTATEKIGEDLWAKMLYNCALNPLGAVLDVPYGALAQQESGRRIMDAVIEEVYAVMGAAGFRTHQPTARDYRRLFSEKLVPATADHHSSTLQDVRAGKKTEIEALNGAVVRLAQADGVAVPVNRTLVNLVRFIESQALKQ